MVKSKRRKDKKKQAENTNNTNAKINQGEAVIVIGGTAIAGGVTGRSEDFCLLN
jgi:preprotein translocase subunit YajC